MANFKLYLKTNIAAFASLVFIQSKGCNTDSQLPTVKTEQQPEILLQQNNINENLITNSVPTSNLVNNLAENPVLQPDNLNNTNETEQDNSISKIAPKTEISPLINEELPKNSELLISKTEVNVENNKSNESISNTNENAAKENQKTDSISEDLPRVICIGQHESGKTVLFNTLADQKVSINDPYFKTEMCGRFSRRNKAKSSSRTNRVFSTRIDSQNGQFEMVDTPNISSYYFADCIENKSLESMQCNLLLLNLDFCNGGENIDQILNYFSDDLYVQDYYEKSDSNPFETLYFDYRDKFALAIHYPERVQKRLEKCKNELLNRIKNKGYDNEKVIFMPDKMDRGLIASEIYKMASKASKSEVNFRYGKEGKPKEIMDAEKSLKNLENFKNRNQIMENSHKLYRERIERERTELRKKAGIILSSMPDYEEDDNED